MSYYFVDVEADGPCPGLYSMIEVGVVVIHKEENLLIGESFYSNLSPVSKYWISDALAVSGYSRDDTLKFKDPKIAMEELNEFISNTNKGYRPIMIADNAGFDWQYVNYYFHTYIGNNPFGYSCISLTSLYKGFDKNIRSSFKRLRNTKHDHNPVNDARGNAEVFIKIKNKGLKI